MSDNSSTNFDLLKQDPKTLAAEMRKTLGDLDDEDDDVDAAEPQEEDDEEEAAPPRAVVEERLYEDTPIAVQRKAPPHKKKRKVRGTAAKETTTMSQKAVPTRQTMLEIPRDEVSSLIGIHSEVRLDIRRTTPNGQHATIRNGIVLPPAALFDLQPVVTAFAGGGAFTFTVSDSITRQQLVTSWRDLYDGRPKEPPAGMTIAWVEAANQLRIVPDSRGLGIFDGDSTGQHWQGLVPGQPQPAPAAQAPHQFPPASAYDARGNLQPPPKELGVPAWMASYPAITQWQFLADKAAKEAPPAAPPNGGGTVALDWVHQNLRDQGHLQAQLSKYEERAQRLQDDHRMALERVKAEFQAKIDASNERAARAERQLEAAQTEAKYATLAAKLESKPQDTLMPALVSLATAFAPLLLENRRQEAALVRDERDQQTKLVTTLLTQKPAPGAFEQLMPVLPVVLPLVMEYMKNNSPRAQAELLDIQAERNMMLLQMIGQTMKDTMPDAPPVWQPLIELAVGGLQTWMARSGQPRLQAPPQHPQLQQGQQRQGPPPAQPTRPPQTPLEAIFEQLNQLDAKAASLTKLVWDRLPVEQGFHSQEWLTIIFNLHARAEVATIAETIVSHLYHCQTFNMMPPVLVDVFDPKQSERVLRMLIDPLPINAEDPDYCSAVVLAVAQHVAETEEDVDGDEGEEDEALEAVEASVEA